MVRYGGTVRWYGGMGTLVQYSGTMVHFIGTVIRYNGTTSSLTIVVLQQCTPEWFQLMDMLYSAFKISTKHHMPSHGNILSVNAAQ